MKPQYRPSFIFNIIAFFIIGFVLPVLLFSLCTGRSEIKTVHIASHEISSQNGHAFSVAYPSELEKKAPFFPLKEYLFDDSKSVLFENGKPLRKRGVEDIREVGEGSYFFCLGTLYFSSSDNTDPRTNGRRYTFSGPVKPWFRSSKFLHLAVCVLGLLLVLIARKMTRQLKIFYIVAGGWIICIVVALPIFLGSSLFTYMPDIIVNKSSIAGDSLWNSIIIESDSATYVNKSTGRAPGYPFFISRIIEITPFHKAITPSTPLAKNPDEHPFIDVSRAQIVLFVLAVFLFGMVLTAYFSISVSYLAGVVLTIFGFSAINYLSRLLSEGVLLSIIIINFAVMVWTIKEPSKTGSAILGFLLFIALLVHPRSIAYAPILLAPAFGRFISSRKIRSLLDPAAWLGPGIFMLFCLGICSYNKYMYNAFSATPFNGYSSISIALEFADPDDYKYFNNQKVKRFVRRSLESIAVSPHRWPDRRFVNYNVWKVATPICEELFKGDKRYYEGHNPNLDTVCNSIFSRVSSILIPKHFDGVMKHIRYSLKQMGKEMPLSMGGHPFWLSLWCILVIRAVFQRNATAAFCSLLMITHYSSMIFTGALQGNLSRYLYTTQWMLPLAACLFGFDLVIYMISVIKKNHSPFVSPGDTG